MIRQFIGGVLVEGEGKVINVTNPADGSIVESFKGASKKQAIQALEEAQKTFKTWKKTPLQERINWLNKFADAVLEEREKIATISSLETGKPFGEAYGDIDFGLTVMRFHAEEIKRVYGTSLQDNSLPVGGAYHIVEKRPIGVVVGHLAWNYPMYNAALKLAPTIVSGCCCVLKPSSQTPLATLYLGEIAKRIGLPDGVINIVAGSSSEVGTALNTSKIPRMIGLIGGTETALRVMADAATSIKRFSFELGGNAPAIVMEDADLEYAANTIVSMKMGNSGQMCIDFNRVYVHESIYEKFCGLLREGIRKYSCGQGRDEGLIIGPMINKEAQVRMGELVEDAVQKGGKLVCGGKVPEGKPDGSSFFEPTMIENCTEDMKVFREEIFGPILAVCSYKDFDEVLQLASATDTGLSSYLYGHDSRKLAKAVEELEYGEVLINVDGIGDVCHLPHVGVKQSGLGCDNSMWSLEEYFDLKRVRLIP